MESTKQVCTTMECFPTRDVPVQCILAPLRVPVTLRVLLWENKNDVNRTPRSSFSDSPLPLFSASAARTTTTIRVPAFVVSQSLQNSVVGIFFGTKILHTTGNAPSLLVYFFLSCWQLFWLNITFLSFMMNLIILWTSILIKPSSW